MLKGSVERVGCHFYLTSAVAMMPPVGVEAAEFEYVGIHDPR